MSDKNKEPFSNETADNLFPDSFLKDSDSRGNKFINTPADDLNDTKKSEAEKEENTKDEDFEKFNVDKADELKKSKNDEE